MAMSSSRCPRAVCGGRRLLETDSRSVLSLVCLLCGRGETLPDPACEALQARDAALALAERDVERQRVGRRKEVHG